MEQVTKIIIIEDDEKIRNYLAALLAGSGEFNLVATFADAEDAKQFFLSDLSENVELVLTDIQLPGQSGIELISWLKPLRHDLQFMVLSAYDDTEKVFSALKAGASGYILKSTPATKLIESLIDLRKGGSPMSSQIARKVVEFFQRDIKVEQPRESLSRREQEVLAFLARGYRYKEIAASLFLSVETVRTHIRNIYEKLHAHSRAEALRKAGLK